MKPDDETLTAQQSLAIITEMISHAKSNFRSNSIYFLLWGCVIALANLGMFALILAHYSRPYVVWSIAIPAWLITIYMAYRQGKKQRMTTHLDRIQMWMWFCFGVVIFTLVGFGKSLNYQLNPVILLISALPTLLSGLMIKFRPLILGGIFFWVCGLLAFVLGGPWQFLVGAVAVTVGYIIPGILLRKKEA
jgi:hypothetical protein